MSKALAAVSITKLSTDFQRARKDLPVTVEFKGLPIEFKVDQQRRRVEGWAAKYGNIDLGRDRILQGAATKTIAERLPKSGIKFMWDHWTPIGMPIVLEDQKDGIFSVAEINAHSEFDQYLSLIDQRVAAHLSIGYSPVKTDFVVDEVGDVEIDVRNILELKLYEYSAVMWPMNEQAEITAVKAAQHNRGVKFLADGSRAIAMAARLLDMDAMSDKDLHQTKDILGYLREISDTLALDATSDQEPDQKEDTTPVIEPSEEAQVVRAIQELSNILAA